MSRCARLSRAALLASCIARAELASPRLAAAEEPAARQTQATEGPSLADLRTKYNAALYQGLQQLRANKQAGEEHIVGDNTDPSGMHWTKPSNLGVDLASALVAAEAGLASEGETRAHVLAVLDALGGLPTYHGIFPEFLQIEGGLRAEIKGDRIRYSAVDSAWLTLSLSLVRSRYELVDRELAQKAGELLDRQDYALFLGADGLMGGGLVLDANTRQVVDSFGFSYGERNSEARVLVLSLVSMGKLPASAWDNMHYVWLLKEGVPVARSWRWSAFVELSGALFFDEGGLAPLSLGKSHSNYLRATRNVARRLQHGVWGYAPSGTPGGGYAEHGLDNPAVVAPYAAALLAASGERSAVSNLDAVLRSLPSDGRPLPDGLDPTTGKVSSPVARTFDQGLLFLALNASTLRGLVQRAPWYASAESKLRDLERTSRPPARVPLAPASSCASCGGPVPGSGSGTAVAISADSPRYAPVSAPAPEARTAPLLNAAELDAALERGRAALHDVVRAAQSSQAAPGGELDLASRQAELEADAVSRAWLQFAPDLTLSLRREFTGDEPGVTAAPSWWGQLEAKLAVSSFKLWGLDIAQRAQGVGATLPAAARQEVQLQALDAQLGLYARERELAALQEQRAPLGAVLAGLAVRPPGPDAEGPLLAARLSALDQAIADAESARERAALDLTALTGESFAESGLDLRLQLEDVLGLIRAETQGVLALGERRAEAEVELQASRLAAEANRVWYFPELRLGVFAAVAKTDAQESTSAPSWVLDRVIGELSAAFSWLPGAELARRAGAAALERSQWQLAELRRARSEAIEVASARLAARSAEWSEGSEGTARELYADRLQRFGRGELDAQALIGAAGTLCEESGAAARLFGEALDAQLLLAGHAPAQTNEAGSGAPPGGPASERWLPHDANLAQRTALARAARLHAARAEALRAQAQAEAVRASAYQLAVEGGIFYPFQVRNELGAAGSVGPGIPAGPAAFGPERTLDVTALARGSLEVTFNGRQALAARAEADLRVAESTLASKAFASEQARARLELAYAHAGLRLASERLELSTGHRSAIERMRAQGYIDDATVSLQAELGESEARRLWQRARSRLMEAQIRARGLLGSSGSGQLEIEETPEELERWLVEAYYPAQGLVGYASDLRLTIAELEARWAEACYQALRKPPSTFSLTLQATQSLLGSGYAVGFGLGFQLDPRTRPADTVDAAERAGDRRGELAALQRSLAGERRRARDALDSALRAQAVEAARRQRLQEILEDLLQAQAADLDRHESSKLRTRDAVQEQLLEAERRLLEIGYELDLARLRWLELGGADTEAVALPALPPAATLESALSQLVEGASAVLRAELAAQAVEQSGVRAPVLAGLHPLGPVLGGAYGVQVSGQPVSVHSRDLQGDLGVGVSYGLDEGLAFLSTGRRQEAAQLARHGARSAARERALDSIGKLWLAHELHGLLSRQEAVSRQRLESLGLPRYSAAHIDSAALASAEAEHANLLIELERVASQVQAQRSALQAQGADVSEPVLQEFASCVVPELGTQPPVKRAPRSEPLYRAAERRSSAADMDTLLAALGVVGPTTLFVELVPQAQTDDLQEGTGWRQRLAGVASLVVPITARAIADGVAASSLSARRDSESHAVETAFVVAGNELDPRIRAALAAWQAASARSAAASQAALELNRLRAGGSVRITVESLSQAQDDAFAAEQVELTARAPVLVLCTEQQALRRPPGAYAASP